MLRVYFPASNTLLIITGPPASQSLQHTLSSSTVIIRKCKRVSLSLLVDCEACFSVTDDSRAKSHWKLEGNILFWLESREPIKNEQEKFYIFNNVLHFTWLRWRIASPNNMILTGFMSETPSPVRKILYAVKIISYQRTKWQVIWASS